LSGQVDGTRGTPSVTQARCVEQGVVTVYSRKTYIASIHYGNVHGTAQVVVGGRVIGTVKIDCDDAYLTVWREIIARSSTCSTNLLSRFIYEVECEGIVGPPPFVNTEPWRQITVPHPYDEPIGPYKPPVKTVVLPEDQPGQPGGRSWEVPSPDLTLGTSYVPLGKEVLVQALVSPLPFPEYVGSPGSRPWKKDGTANSALQGGNQYVGTPLDMSNLLWDLARQGYSVTVYPTDYGQGTPTSYSIGSNGVLVYRYLLRIVDGPGYPSSTVGVPAFDREQRGPLADPFAVDIAPELLGDVDVS